MKKTKKMSKRTALLLAAALVLLSVGTFTGVMAQPNIMSNLYRAHFYLNHLQVHLLENGQDVCGGQNDLNGEAKVSGKLAQKLGYNSDSDMGSVEPGKVYDEVIQAGNSQDVSEFVRITVRKYWVLTKDGKVVTTENAAGKTVPKKTTELSPDLIQLMYDGKEECNPAWEEVPQETTTESTTYIYKDLLKGGSRSNPTLSEPLFNQLKIDESVAEREDEPKVEKTEDGRTIYTYIYKYDGYAFYIEADVQAIQTHNAQDAIKSQWGPYINATYSIDNDTGSLSVQ